MTDRSADIDALGLPVRRRPPRRLGRGARLAVAAAVALALLVVLGGAWLQLAVLADLPSPEALHAPPAAPSALAKEEAPRLAPALADSYLKAPEPSARRELQRKALALRLRQTLTPDQIRELYLQRMAPPPPQPVPPDARAGFYRALAADFAAAERPTLRGEERR